MKWIIQFALLPVQTTLWTLAKIQRAHAQTRIADKTWARVKWTDLPPTLKHCHTIECEKRFIGIHTSLLLLSLRLESQLIHIAEVVFRAVPRRRDAILCSVTSEAPLARTVRAWQLDISQWLDGWRAQFLLFSLTPLHEPKWAYEIKLTSSDESDQSLNSVFSSSNILYFLLGASQTIRNAAAFLALRRP